MPITEFNASNLKVFLNHVYEFKKGVRQMVLYTTNQCYEDFITNHLNKQHIDYHIQTVDHRRINIFFGKKECIETIRMMITRPVYELTPEEDFILGALLGYDICGQCSRYCQRKTQHDLQIVSA